MWLRYAACLISFLATCSAQSPDYSKKTDILNGRRVLLQVDDIVLFGESVREDTQYHDMGFNFYNSTNSSFSAPGGNPLANTSVVPTGVQSRVMYGRWWDSTTDIPALIFHNNPATLTIVLDRRSNTLSGDLNTVHERTGMPCALAEDFTGDGYDDLMLATTPAGYGDGYITLITASDTTKPSVPKFGTSVPVSRCMAMAHGDFNGDGALDLAYVSPTTAGGIQITIYTIDPKALTLTQVGSYTVNTDNDGPPGEPINHAAITAGAFRPEAQQQLAIAYAPDYKQTIIKTIDLDPQSFSMKEVDRFETGSWPRIDGLIGVQAAKLFGTDPKTYLVFFFAWHGNAGRQGAANKYLKVFGVDPTLKMTAHPNYDFSTYDCVQGFAIGNFDYHVKIPNDPNNGMELSLDRQLALVGGDCDGPQTLDLHVLTLATDLTMTDTKSTVPSPFPNSKYLTMIQGDAQGRSLVLGPPSKVTLNQNLQTTVVVAAPPAHVDYIVPAGGGTPTVVNISALPQSFKTSYAMQTKGSSQSTNTSSTSWGVGATESVNQTISIGDVDEGDGLEEKSSFTAAQEFKGESDKENGSYTSVSYDVSSNSANGDNFRYSNTTLNVWTYPVRGKMVCPKKIPNCSDSEKVPLTLVYSAPDTIVNGSTTQQVSPWYQPTWEYGNLFSYPANQAQLEALIPGIEVLTQAATLSTSGGAASTSVNWSSGQHTGLSSSFTQNYSFDASLSVQGAIGLDGFSVGGGYSFDVSGSFGLSSQTTSQQSLDKSDGLTIDKPTSSFRAPTLYNYSFSPYVFGRKKPENVVDSSKVPTGDVNSFGALRSAFTADIVSSSAAGFWRQAYSDLPDIGLSHPAKWNHTTEVAQDNYPTNCLLSGANNSEQDCFDVHQHQPQNPWVSPSLWMQGFFITNASAGQGDPGQPGAGPNLSITRAGTLLTLRARVYNFSFKQMDPSATVHVQFYGTEFDIGSNKPIGAPFKIGKSNNGSQDVVLPPIPPLTDDSDGRNWVYAEAEFDTTPYSNKRLVFWVLVWAQQGSGGNSVLVKEIAGHGLANLPPDVVTDMATVPVEMNPSMSKEMVTYSNNLGFYRSYLHVTPDGDEFRASMASADRTAVRLASVQLSANSVSRNQRIEISAALRPQSVPAPGAFVSIYDGHPDENGTLIHAEHIPWINAGERHQIRVVYTPRKTGLRRIWAIVNQGAPYESVRASGILCVGRSCFLRPMVAGTRSDEAPDPREKQ
jgi:hypothetical protein